MQRTDTSKASDEIAEALKSYIRECALLLLGAMGKDGTFPIDLSGITTLIGRSAEPEQGLGDRRFAAESPDDLHPSSGEGIVWVSPVDDKALRLRAESGIHASLVVILRSNGELGQFTVIKECGGPKSEMGGETKALPHNGKSPFSTERLVGVQSAPRNDLAGLVVTWIALYDSGLIIHYLTPNSEAGGEGPIRLYDDVGTNYSPIGLGDVELAAPPLRSLEFAPAVPAGASRLTIACPGGRVEIRMVR